MGRGDDEVDVCIFFGEQEAVFHVMWPVQQRDAYADARARRCPRPEQNACSAWLLFPKGYEATGADMVMLAR